MRVRSRLVADAEQWDGTSDEANRLGLVLLCLSYASDKRVWHLPTTDGPVMMRAGDWIVTDASGRTRYSAEAFWRTYEDLP